jgi:hypothetical protein
MTKKRQKREVGDGNKKFNTTEIKTMYNKSNKKLNQWKSNWML